LTLTTSLINRSDCDSNRCEFELTTTLRSHDTDFDEMRRNFEWFWWDEMRIKKKKVVSRIRLLCAYVNIVQKYCHAESKTIWMWRIYSQTNKTIRNKLIIWHIPSVIQYLNDWIEDWCWLHSLAIEIIVEINFFLEKNNSIELSAKFRSSSSFLHSSVSTVEWITYVSEKATTWSFHQSSYKLWADNSHQFFLAALIDVISTVLCRRDEA
jgi:hypothetical protein